MTRRARMALIGVVLAAAAVTLWFVRRSPEPRGTADDRATGGSEVVTGAGAASTTAGIADPDEPAEPTRFRTLDADQRGALMQRIGQARAARMAGTPAAPPRDPDDLPPLPGTISNERIAEAVADVHGLLLECYTEAVDDLAVTDGKLTVALKLVGEPEVGTLIESTGLTGDAHLLAHAELSRCIQETTMSIELPPLAEGSELEVTLPMWFTAGPRDAG